MTNDQLINPGSIVVVGGSNDLGKPGGKVLKNLIDGGYQGKLFVTNPKESEVQGIPAFPDAEKLPDVDLAIFAIPARFIPETAEVLAQKDRKSVG